MSNIQIAIDGPASSGKSTVAKEIAQKLKITYIDTGAMYRAVTYGVLQADIDLSDESAIAELLGQLDISFQQEGTSQQTYLNDEDVTLAIRSEEVTANVSLISSYQFVREYLVAKQQEMAQKHSVIMDGHDIGTVVLPQADFKFFLVADAEVRAKRRFKENQERGISDSSLEEIKAAIIERDHLDSTREHSPLKQADDAIVIDSSLLTINEVTNKILSIINE